MILSQTYMLGSVVGVDADVLVSQIGCPEFAGAMALMKVDGDGELGLLNVGVCGVLVVRVQRCGFVLVVSPAF